MNRVRTFAFLCLFLALFTATAFSQMEIKKGIKGGLNVADLEGSGIRNTDIQVIYNFGVFANIALFDLVSVQPEVNYSMKGAKQTFEIEGGTYDFNYDLVYVEFPLLIKLSIPFEPTVAPSLFGGAAFAYNLSARGRITVGSQASESDLTDFRRSEYSAVAGASIEFPPVIFEVRYYHGLTSIFNSTDTGKITNRVVAITAGFVL